jgi:CO dehydrogenase maturation factor
MSYTIAVAGKGGTGKTTVASLIIRRIIERGAGPVLAVDADPNSNLAEAFGADIPMTVGKIMHDFLETKIDIPMGMTKESFLDLKLNTALIETKHLDFIVMGRKHGPGCYCYPNVLLKNFVSKLSGNYPYTAIDNEAGMEHLSRKNAEVIDLLALVADHSVRGLRAVKRVLELADELDIRIKNRILVVNRFREENAELLAPNVREVGVEKVFTIAEDPMLVRADAEQVPVMLMSEDIKAVGTIARMTDEVVFGAADGS